VNDTPPKPISTYIDTIKYCLHQSSVALNITPLADHQILWYDTARVGGISTSTATVPKTDSAGDFNYYVSQLNNKGCISGRTSISVKVFALPDKPLVYSNSVCRGNITSLQIDSLSGTTYTWFTSLTNGTLLHQGSRFDSIFIALDTFKVFVSASKNGCESDSRTAAISVINEIPTMPIVHSDTVCKGALSSAWTDSLPGITYKWYNAFSGGILIHQGSTLDTLINTLDTATLYVSATRFGCESNRTLGKIMVKPMPVAPIVYSDTVCKGNKSKWWVDSLQGVTYNWYNAFSGGILIHQGSTLDTLVNTLDTATLYVSATRFGCESNRTLGKIIVKPIPAAPTVYSDTVCKGNKSKWWVDSLQGVTYNWYNALTNGAIIHTGKSFDTLLPTIDTFKLYISAINNGCESSRSGISVQLKNKLAKPELIYGDTIQYCLNTLPVSLSNNVSSFNNLLWYDTLSVGGQPSLVPVLPDVSKSGITNYYVSQINERYCESDRKQITVKVNPKPAPPLVQSFNFCADQQTHVLTITPTQRHVNIWFGTDTLANTTSQNPPEILANKPGVFKYYVSQYNVTTGCMSNASAVNVNIWAIPEIPLIKQDAAGKLISSIPIGNKWYTDSMILSDTGAVIQPPKNGYYTVRATVNGCNSVMSKKYYYQLAPINDLAPNEYFNLFPNPFTTSFRIDFSIYQTEKINVSIYELGSGKLLEQRLNITTGTVIPLHQLMEGVYIVKVATSNNQRTIVRKIIKSNK
jgi:hypothetical protein